MAKKKMTLEEKLEEAIVKEEPYEIPDNWIWSNIGSVSFEIKSGTTIKQNKGETGVKVTRIESLQNNSIDLNRLGTVMDEAKVREQDYYVDGDIALSHINSIEHVGKTVLIDDSLLPLVHGMNLLRIRFNKELILPEYFQFYTRGYDYKKFVVERVNRAVNQVSLNQKNLSSVPIPFPILSEQQRIVDKIESLFEKIDKAKELIEAARDEFENRKAAILEKAFRGELTEKWRVDNNSNDNETLDNILAQNRIHKKNFELTIAEELFNIPESWRWYKLKDLCEKFKYGTSKKSSEEGRVPVLRMGNLQKGILDWEKLVYTDDLVEIEKYNLKSGDLLFNRTNSPELVGKTSIYLGEREAIYAGYLIRVRVLECMNSKYINYFMNSIFAKERCMEVKSDGVSQSNINAEKLGDFDIPLPTLNEQEEVVNVLESLLIKEKDIENLTKLEEKIELIKKSILAKAFRGELGTNNPEEESAIELLKEILSEK